MKKFGLRMPGMTIFIGNLRTKNFEKINQLIKDIERNINFFVQKIDM